MPLGNPTTAVASSSPKPAAKPGLLASLSSLTSSIGKTGSLTSMFSQSRVIAGKMSAQDQIQASMRAFTGFHHYSEETATLLERIQADNAANTDENRVSLHAMPVLYDGDKMPAAAWGSKFNAMPVYKEIGGTTAYKNLISPSDAIWPYWTMRTTFRVRPSQLNPLLTYWLILLF
jgi:hypothetical protein